MIYFTNVMLSTLFDNNPYFFLRKKDEIENKLMSSRHLQRES